MMEGQPKPPTAILTVKQAAAALGVSPTLVYAIVEKRKIRHERIGLGRGVIRIPEDALEEYRKSREVGVVADTPPPDRRPRIKRDPMPVTGTVFGKWTILEVPRVTKSKILCRCECGIEHRVRFATIKSGESRQCPECSGYSVMRSRDRSIADREGGLRLHAAWVSMKDRCYNRNNKSYKNYGGRGIKVCVEWLNNYDEFQKWAVSNGYSDDLTLDRYPDNDGNYEPSNCRWATMKQQHRNTRRNTVVDAFGESKSLADWAEDARCAVTLHVLYDRISSGMDAEKAILAPLRKQQGNPDEKHLDMGSPE